MTAQSTDSPAVQEDMNLYYHDYTGDWYSVGFTNEHGEERVTPLLTWDEAQEFMQGQV